MNIELVTREDLEKQALAHYKTPGAKNGVRRYQYEDGSLTPLGRIHYGVGLGRDRSLIKGKTGFVAGKKLVEKDGSLTKHGTRKIEETMKDGSYLNPSQKEKKSGKAVERDKVGKEYEKEYRDLVPWGKSAESVPEEKLKDVWDKYKDKYAEATLKDLKLPVTESNKGAVKDAMKRYDPEYDTAYLKDGSGEDHRKKIADNREQRFKKDLDEKSNKEIKKDVEDQVKNINDKTKTFADKQKEKAAKNAEERAKLRKEIGDIRTLADEELDKRIQRLQKEKQYSELLNERAHREKGPFEKVASEYFKKFGERLANKAIDKLTDKILQKVLKDPTLNKNQNPQNNNPQTNSNPNNQPNNSNPKPNPSPNQNPNSGNGQRFSKAEKSRIRSMAGSGKSVAEIAKALGTTEDRVKNYMSAAGVTIS